jgi:hypothetical protein
LRKKTFALGDHFNILSNTMDYNGSPLPANRHVIPGACAR